MLKYIGSVGSAVLDTIFLDYLSAFLRVGLLIRVSVFV
jgi:hypothetical protein